MLLGQAIAWRLATALGRVPIAATPPGITGLRFAHGDCRVLFRPAETILDEESGFGFCDGSLSPQPPDPSGRTRLRAREDRSPQDRSRQQLRATNGAVSGCRWGGAGGRSDFLVIRVPAKMLRGIAQAANGDRCHRHTSPRRWGRCFGGVRVSIVNVHGHVFGCSFRLGVGRRVGRAQPRQSGRLANVIVAAGSNSGHGVHPAGNESVGRLAGFLQPD